VRRHSWGDPDLFDIIRFKIQSYKDMIRVNKSESLAQNLCNIPLKPSKISEEFLFRELRVIQNLSKLCPKLAEEK
jgi:hypothetical protein